MTKKEIVKLLDGWFSKKWVITLLCFATGSMKAFFFEPLSPSDVSFFLGIAAIYGGVNVANKTAVLKNINITSEVE